MPFEQVNVSTESSTQTETAGGPSAEVYQAETTTETAGAESAPDSTYFVNASEGGKTESAEGEVESSTEDVQKLEAIREELDKVPEMANENITHSEAPTGTVFFANAGRVIEGGPTNSVTMKEQYKVCERCKGNGRIWLGLRTCPVCKGKGQLVTTREHSVTQSV